MFFKNTTPVHAFVLLAVVFLVYAQLRGSAFVWNEYPIVPPRVEQHGTPVQDTPCSITRIERYKEICKANPVRYKKPIMHYMLLDHESKVFGCLINKAGSASWGGFVMRSKDPTLKQKEYKSTEVMTRNHLEKLIDISLSKIAGNYRNWTKYILVRHPLQRLVSGYYQGIVHAGIFGNSIMAFDEFLKVLVDKRIRNIHWKLYTESCNLCDVDYDYVFKQETVNDDIVMFHKFSRSHANVTIDQYNVNKYILKTDTGEAATCGQMNKYDEMLGDFQRENPRYMKKLIAIYQYDMDLFGYGWDWDNARSTCINNPRNHKCC